MLSRKEIKELLVKQLVSSVLWEDSVKAIIELGCTNFIEIGPGNVLKGLLRRIDKELDVKSVDGDLIGKKNIEN